MEQLKAVYGEESLSGAGAAQYSSMSLPASLKKRGPISKLSKQELAEVARQSMDWHTINEMSLGKRLDALVVGDLLRKQMAEMKKTEAVEGLTSEEAARRLKQYGRNELPEKTKSKWKMLFEQFTQPMPVMVWIALIVEAGLTNWPDFGVLMFLQLLNGGVGFYETSRAGDAVAALKAALKPAATCKRDGRWGVINAAELVPGDLVLLASGAAVPADVRIVGAHFLDIDQSSLTGESLPVQMGQGDIPKMGSTVSRGEAEGVVEQTGAHTFFGKTASLIHSVEGMGHFQKVLLQIMFFLFGFSILFCTIAFVYQMIDGRSFRDSIEFSVVVLVASIPIAMELVCTTTMALGSRKLAAKDAIVSRLAAIEDVAGMNMLCSDKTGTLTLNKMVIQEECPIFTEGHDQASVLVHGALAAKWLEPPKDALDTLVLGSVDKSKLEGYEMVSHMPFDPTVKRTESTVKAPDGTTFKVTKGAPQIVMKLIHDRDEIGSAVDEEVMAFAARGIRSLAIARTVPGDIDKWQLLGILTFLDPPRPDSAETLRRAKAYSVDVKMITGDHAAIAMETMRLMGCGTNILDSEMLPSLGKDEEGHLVVPKDLGQRFGTMIEEADGFAQVFPEHKFLLVEALRQKGYVVGMTGDGVNDAPALKRADVGIAVEGATDAARGAADIVITSPGLSVIIDAIIISRGIFQRMKNYVIYRMACTLQLLFFFFIAIIGFHPRNFATGNDQANAEEWPGYFDLPVIALIIITLLNDGGCISIAYDNVAVSEYPEKWHLRFVYTVASVLGSVAMCSSLVLLYWSLDFYDPNRGFLRKLGLSAPSYGEVQSAIYLKVSISDFLTLFAARTTSFFWTSRPAPILLVAGCLAMAVSTIFSVTWPFGDGMDGLNWTWVVFVWVYCVIWFLIQDATKVLVYKLYYRFFFTKPKKIEHRVVVPDAHNTSYVLGGQVAHTGHMSQPPAGSGGAPHDGSPMAKVEEAAN
eukprot:jgi/Mesvir1/11910/Mv00250-RA.1